MRVRDAKGYVRRASSLGVSLPPLPRLSAFHAKLTVCSHTVGRGAGIMAAEKMTERKSGRKGGGAAIWARVCRALSA